MCKSVDWIFKRETQKISRNRRESKRTLNVKSPCLNCSECNIYVLNECIIEKKMKKSILKCCFRVWISTGLWASSPMLSVCRGWCSNKLTAETLFKLNTFFKFSSDILPCKYGNSSTFPETTQKLEILIIYWYIHILSSLSYFLFFSFQYYFIRLHWSSKWFKFMCNVEIRTNKKEQQYLKESLTKLLSMRKMQILKY